MSFTPQRRATFHLSPGQMAPHPAALASLLFDHKSLGKNSVSRLSYLFAHLDLLFSSSFSPLIFSLSLFSLFSYLLFSDSSHLCFSSVHIVRSLTSKLPSAIQLLTTAHAWHVIMQDSPWINMEGSSLQNKRKPYHHKHHAKLVASF